MRSTLTGAFLTAFAMTTSAAAADLVRDAGQIATISIQGVSLDDTPREAFEHLTLLGYGAGGIETFADWDEGGIEMVRGTYSDAEGESRVTLMRAGRRLVNIMESFNRPRAPFDSEAEMNAVRSHFGITEDDANCQLNAARSGVCRVADAEEEENLVYGISVFPTMIQRYATRTHDLKHAD